MCHVGYIVGTLPRVGHSNFQKRPPDKGFRLSFFSTVGKQVCLTSQFHRGELREKVWRDGPAANEGQRIAFTRIRGQNVRCTRGQVTTGRRTDRANSQF